MTNILNKNKIILLDGAMGTQLQSKGLPVGACPEKWCLENPEKLSEVHTSYIKAGSDIIYSCTFGANRFKLKEYNISDVISINCKLAKIAKKTAKGKALVAGDIGPTGKFIFPYGEVNFEDAVNIFKEQVKGLLKGGVDLFVIETMMDLQEARATLLAVKETTNKPVIVTMTFDKEGRTLNGNDPLSCLITLQSLGANAFGCNCSVGPKEMVKVIKDLKKHASIPLIAKANAGLPRLEDDETVFDMSASVFAKKAVNLVKAGVNLIGGCCGTSPEHIKAVAKILKSSRSEPPRKTAISAVCSSRKTFIMNRTDPKFFAIGEKINPTGKKLFQQALACNDLSVIRNTAQEQHKTVPKNLLFDVNVGVPNVNEKKLLEKAIGLLCPTFDHPMVIDSSDVKALEHALRIYPGRAIINSISAEKEKLETMLPIAAKYGAMFIVLPIGQKKLPKTFMERKTLVQQVITKSKSFGITKDNIIVDALSLSISSNPEAVNEILKTIEWANKDLGVNTVIGLSNISFGLPRRDLVNTAFLKLAIAKGLSSAILDPTDFVNWSEKNICKQALNVLAGKDKDAKKYIAYVMDLQKKPLNHSQQTSSGSDSGHAKTKDQRPEQVVFNTILDGDRENIELAIEKALSKKIKPEHLLNKHMIPAINEAGIKFEKKELFLPQLLASAETMKKGFEKLQPLLGTKTKEAEKKVILATVQGDIHDIGKNIISLMLKNQGFTIIDLGNDVQAEKIISSAKKHKPIAIGLSALMTTTMVNMKKVISLMEKEKLNYPVFLGGAVVTKEFSNSIGGIYASDGVATVRILKKIVQDMQ